MWQHEGRPRAWKDVQSHHLYSLGYHEIIIQPAETWLDPVDFMRSDKDGSWEMVDTQDAYPLTDDPELVEALSAFFDAEKRIKAILTARFGGTE